MWFKGTRYYKLQDPMVNHKYDYCYLQLDERILFQRISLQLRPLAHTFTNQIFAEERFACFIFLVRFWFAWYFAAYVVFCSDVKPTQSFQSDPLK